MVCIHVLELSLELLVEHGLAWFLGAFLRILLELTQIYCAGIFRANVDDFLQEVLVNSLALGRLAAGKQNLQAQGNVLLLVLRLGGRLLINIQCLEDLGKLHEEQASVAVHLDEVLRAMTLLLLDSNVHIDQLIQEIVVKMCCLNQKLTKESDQSQLDIREVDCLVVCFHNVEHVDEVEPVAGLLLVLVDDEWLLENELAD